MGKQSSSPLPANLRRLRLAKGLSVVQLARAAEVGRATLTQIEAGSGNPTLETLYALANVLTVPLADLIAEPEPAAGPRVIRRGEGEAVSGEAVDAWLLHRQHTSSLIVEIYALSIRDGASQRSAAHPRGSREHVHVHSGSVQVGPIDRPLTLNPGDYADYPADIAHQYHAVGDATVAATLNIMTPV